MEEEETLMMRENQSEFRFEGNIFPADTVAAVERIEAFFPAYKEYLRAKEKLLNTVNTESNKEEHATEPRKAFIRGRPPAGKRTIDYLVRALSELDGTANLLAVHKKMLDLGWETTSKTDREITNNLTSTVRDYAQYVYINDNLQLSLKEEGRAFLPQIVEKYNALVKASLFTETREDAAQT